MKEKKRKTKNRRILLKRIVPVAAIILLVSGFLAYSNSFDASFHWDDTPQILRSEKVQNLSTFADGATWMKINWRPFSVFTLALNWAAGENQVFGYHLLNLLLHILTAFLVFLLARKTIGLLAGDDRLDQRYKDLISVFVALLFLLHPLQTMAVTYIVQRMAVLAALFYILALLLYVRGRIAYLENGINRKSVGLIILAFLAGIFGILSKQNAASFPAAFLLYELFFIRRPDGKMCKTYIFTGFGILFIGFIIVLISGSLPAETNNFTRIEYLSAQFGIFYKYILLILLPLSQNADYYIRVEPPLFGIAQFIGIAIILGLVTLGVYMFKRNKLISFGIFWIFLSMFIESGLIPIRDIMMEHRMYLPMFGVGMITAGLVMNYVKYSSKAMVYVVGVVVFFLMAFGTYQRNKVWKTDLTLWQDCLDKNPDNPRAMSNLGLAIKTNADYAANPQQRKAELNEAIRLFTESMQSDTIFIQAYINRSLTYLELEQYQRSLNDIYQVAETWPDKGFIKLFIEGVIMAKQGQWSSAMNNFNEVVRIEADFAPVYMWRGLVCIEQGEYERAIGNYRLSLKNDPSQINLYIPISDNYVRLKNWSKALEWLKKAQNAGLPVIPGNMQRLQEMVQIENKSEE